MTTSATLDPKIEGLASLAGKYLTFTLGRESYGIGVLKVREIIRIIDVTSVPQMPPYIKGVVNLRGKVVPVVDLRIRFELADVAITERTCIVVVQLKTSSGGPALIGLIVDGVEEVVNITPEDLEPTPDFGTVLDTQYIVGMAKLKGRVKTLLDIERLISADAVKSLVNEAGQTGQANR